MKRILLTVVAIGACTVPSFAEWIFVPLDQLIQDSDLIVVGTLDGVSKNTQGGIDYEQGTIRIDEVIWGAAKAGDLPTLKWQTETGLYCPRLEHQQKQGIKGIWLLTVEAAEGVVRADYPLRFVDLGERANVERFLVKNKVCLRAAKHFFEIDEPANVTLVFRNPTQSPIEFPGVEYKNGRLVVGPGVALALHRLIDARPTRTPVSNRVLSSQELKPILVEPQHEFRVTVDLKKLFKVVSEQLYSVGLRVKGRGRANEVSVYPKLVTHPKN